MQSGEGVDENADQETGLGWTDGKAAHIKLSDAVADQYDEIYEDSNFATGSYMRYELDTISRFAPDAPQNTIAVDLGCGTGRDSFHLCRHFQQVYGYDFSPEMIRVANSSKLSRRAGNVAFEVRDIEDGALPLEDDSIALVNTAFGMGSFVHSPEQLFREVRRVLMPRGIALFSFYNANALVNQLELEWQPALAARVLPGENALQVNFSGNIYTIAAKAYVPALIKKQVENNFSLLEISTFPTLSALFPQSMFENMTARKLCSDVDKSLSLNLEIAAGPYIVVACRKGGKVLKPAEISGYERVLDLLRRHDVKLDVREHEPVRTMDDVFRIIEDDPSRLVKSILVAVGSNDDAADPDAEEGLDAEIFLIAIPADRSLDLGKLASVIKRPRSRIRLASQLQVERLSGFRVGSIPPFGLPRHIPVIIDERLLQHKLLWCGTGRSTESLRISLDNLMKLSMAVPHDVSKTTVHR